VATRQLRELRQADGRKLPPNALSNQ